MILKELNYYDINGSRALYGHGTISEGMKSKDGIGKKGISINRYAANLRIRI